MNQLRPKLLTDDGAVICEIWSLRTPDTPQMVKSREDHLHSPGGTGKADSIPDP